MANKRFPPPPLENFPVGQTEKDPPAVFALVSSRGATPVELSSLPSCFLFPANFNGIFGRPKILCILWAFCKFLSFLLAPSFFLDPIFCKERLIEYLPSTAVRRRYLKLNENFAYFRTFATETYCRREGPPLFFLPPNRTSIKRRLKTHHRPTTAAKKEQNRRHSF